MGRIEFNSTKQQEKYKEKPYLAGLFDIRKKYPEVDELLEELENFDHITFQHCLRVEAFASNLASELGFNEEDKRTFCLAALLHDIGKINIDKNVINDKIFTDEDMKKMRPHVVAGFKKVYEMCPDAAEIILHHHCFQKYPYPSDEEISVISKIDDPVKMAKIEKMANYLALVDNFEVHSGERPNKKPEPLKIFLPEMRKQFGSADDEKAIRILMKTLSKEKIIKRLHPNISSSSNLYLKHPIQPLPEIFGEMHEADDFWRKYGFGEIGNRREILFNSLSQPEKERMAIIEKETDDLVNDIQKLPEVQRLNLLMQLGGTAERALQSRFNHSELLTEQVKFTGVKLGFPIEEIKISMASSWLHDIGHAALCHVSDVVLEKYGHGNHEQRTIKAISNKKGEIYKILAKHNIDPNQVIETIEEKGYLGTMQSVFDTLSYLIIDSNAARRPIYEDQGAELISDLKGIDKEKGLLVVKTPFLWQELLENRATMMKEVYLHPNNRRHRAAFRALMEIAVKYKLISFQQIEKGTDKNLEMNFQSLVQLDKGAALLSGKTENFPFLESYKNIWGLRYGPVDSNEWEMKMFENKGEMSEYLSEIFPKDRLMEALEQTIIVAPFDYTKKEITVLPEGAKNQVTLKAESVELRREDTQYTVYIPLKFKKESYAGKK